MLEPEAAPDPLNQALMEAAQWKDAAHRAAAELDNFRKRTARDLQETVKYANANLLESLPPVLDNFDYGMAAAKAESEGSNLYIGLSMVLRQVQDFLKDNGVEEIPALGAPSTPTSTKPSPSSPAPPWLKGPSSPKPAKATNCATACCVPPPSSSPAAPLAEA